MACEIATKKANEFIQRNIDAISERYGIELTNEKIITEDELKEEFNDETLMSALNVLAASTAGSQVYITDSKLVRDGDIRIRMQASDAFVKSLEQNSREEEMEIEKMNSDKSNYQRLTAEHLEPLFREKLKEMNSFLLDVTEILGKSLKVQDVKKIIYDKAKVNPQLVKSLSEIARTTQDLLGTSLFKESSEAAMAYFVEINILTKQLSKLVEEIYNSNDENKFVKINELWNLAAGNKEIITNFRKNFLYSNPNNPFVDLINETFNELERIESFFTEVGLEDSVINLKDTLTPHLREMQEKHDKEITRLENEKEKYKNNKTISNSLDKAIQKEKERFEEFAPKESKIKDVLIGKEGDITYWTALVRSAITNPDLVIGGFAKMIENALQTVRERVLEKSNQMQGMLDEFLKKEGKDKTPLNLETLFKELITEIKIPQFRKGKEEVYTQVRLLSNIKDSYYQDKSNFRLRFNKSRAFLNESNENLNDLVSKEKLGEKLPKDYSLKLKEAQDIYNTAVKNYQEIRIEYKDWMVTNHEMGHDSKYYEPDVKYKNVFVYKDGEEIKVAKKVPDNIVDFIYVGEALNEVDSKLRKLYREVQSNQGIETEEMSERRRDLKKERADLRNPELYEEGTIERRVAELLLAYNKEKNAMRSYELTPETLAFWQDKYDTKKEELKNGIITLEEYERWKEINVMERWTQEFKDLQKEVHENLNLTSNAVKEYITNKTGEVFPEKDLEELWTQLRLIANPYRRNNIINGRELQKFDKEGFDKSKELEDSINELNQQVSMSGLTKEERQDLELLQNKINSKVEELEEMKREIKELKKTLSLTNDPKQQHLLSVLEDNRNILGGEISKLIKNKKTFLEDAGIKDKEFKLLKKAWQGALQDLQRLQGSVPTEYFDKENDLQLEAYIQSKEYNGEEFKYSGDTYKVVDNISYKNDEVFDENIEEVYQSSLTNDYYTDKDSWYNQNTIMREFFQDGKMVAKHQPYYVWRRTVPKNDKHKEVDQPGDSWGSMKVNEDLLNEDNLDILESPKLKTTSSYLGNEAYNSLATHKRDYLENLRTIYYEAQKHYPKEQRMGDLLPAIERDLDARSVLWDRNKNTFSSAKEQILRFFKTTEQDRDTELGDTAGRINKFIPVYFKGEIDSTIISRNLHTSITKYVHAAEKWKVLDEEVMPKAAAIQNTLFKNTPETDKKDALVESILDKVQDRIGEKLNLSKNLKRKGDSNTRLKILNSYIDMFLYGERVIKEEVKIKDKKYRLDKPLRQLLGFRSFGMLATLPISGYGMASQLGNWIGANANQLTKSQNKQGNRAFSPKTLVSAYKEILTMHSSEMIQDWVGGKTGLKSKFNQMMDVYGVFNQGLSDAMGEEIKERGARSLNGNLFFWLKNGVEILLDATTFLAVAKTHLVKYEKNGKLEMAYYNGSPVTVMDYHSHTNGRLTNVQLTDKDGNLVEWDKGDQSRFRDSFRKSIRDVNGAYSDMDKTLAERNWIGTVLFWMKKFLIPFVENSWSTRRFSVEEGSHIQGFWRETISIVFEEMLPLVREGGVRALAPYWSDVLSEKQKGQVAQSGMQVMVVLVVSQLLLGMLGYDEDDKDRFTKMKNRSSFWNWLTFGLIKGNMEAQTVMMPSIFNEGRRFIQNPVSQTIPFSEDIFNILSHTLGAPDEGFLEKYKSKNRIWDKGDPKLYNDLYKLIGYMPSKMDDLTAIKNRERLSN